MFSKLIQPAVNVLNRLPFKYKIVVSISVLFLLLILPSRTTFINYIDKKERYNSQFIGLNYVTKIHALIHQIQMHRGLTNGYLSGNESFKKSILKSEKAISQELARLVAYDRKRLNILHQNSDFVEALARLELIKIKNIVQLKNRKTIFSIHTKIIMQLIDTLQQIAIRTAFANSEDESIVYIARLLEEKLLLLEENIGQIRGIAVAIFAQKRISKTQKRTLLTRYTLIKSLEDDLRESTVLRESENYLDLQKEIVLAIHQLDAVLAIVNEHILLAQSPAYNSERFFKKATEVLDRYSQLYTRFANSYKKLLAKSDESLQRQILLITAGFILILLSALYIFAAFYRSIAQSLKKLQHASEMIAEGKTEISLNADTKDEIGNALIAFNHMSQKLRKNISFLDSYKMAIDETSIVSKTDPKGIITYVNKLFCEISGYSKHELIGRSHNIVRHPDTPRERFADLWKTIKSKKVWHGVLKNRRKDGGDYIVDATIIPVLDSQGEIVEYIGVRHDVTELEMSKEEIRKQKIDLLTGLPNRNQLFDDLKTFKKPILFYLNIDDFASLNDFYGVQMGDRVLIHLAKILKNIAARSGSKLYKLQVDEFLLLFEEGALTHDNDMLVMGEIINHIEKETAQCDATECVSVSLSGGIAFYDSDENYDNLIICATLARKVAKKENRKFLRYTPLMNKDSDYHSVMEWINKIKNALAEDRITVFFQPIVDNRTGAITKYEALVRMIDEEGKAVSPFLFLDIAKKAKLYTKITKVVFDKTFSMFENYPQYDFSLNITLEDILDEEVSSYIFNKLIGCSRTDHIILEITESEEIKDYTPVNDFIKKVKEYGAKIAIDDFGSGYANFEHIIALHADFIKIDGTLIKNIDTSEDARIITEAIIAFSKKLGSKTVVEFVHNASVYEKVKEMGADYSQGYYLGEPAPKVVDLSEKIGMQSQSA
jgi:PAS domain S-box-containing protein/diguanylate cyclase (GGDEF)-like protein